MAFLLLHIIKQEIILEEFEDYKEYTTEDFVEDASFTLWVLQPTEKSNYFWRTFVEEYPIKESQVEDAQNLVSLLNQHFHNSVKSVSEESAMESLDKVTGKIATKERKIKAKKNRYAAISIAASFLILLAAFFSYYQHQDTYLEEYLTHDGKQLKIDLPDGSIAHLNSNSSISFNSKNWNEFNDRIVYLEGEAFFDVTTIGSKFIVNTGELDITVLGTQFNVKSRNDKSEVVLEEGEIELSVNQQKIMMSPGDFISYSEAEEKINVKKVVASEYSAWKDGIVVLNSNLLDVTKELEVLYGIEFIIEKEELKDRIIQLSVPADSLHQVLDILGSLYKSEMKIKQEKNKIIIY